jgi:CRP-like cAMP-binding protein
MSHEVLASMIGVSRVTVTRQIGALVRSGIIDRDKRHLIVLHPHRLHELAQLP